MCRTLLKLMLAVIMVGSLAMLAGCSANTEGGAILLGAAEEIDGEAGNDVDVDGDGEQAPECPDCICDCGDDCCDGGDITVTCECEAEAHAECNCCDCCDKDEGFCGDEILQSPPEQCEVGINPCPDHMVCNEDTCLCELPPFCGDGTIDPGEECGEPDLFLCSRDEVCNEETCLCEPISYCGDGVVEGDEECDDGNDDNTDGCLDTCLNASCGDGFVWDGYEECEEKADCGVTADFECINCECVVPQI